MGIANKKCPECSGSGRVLKHMYDSGTASRLGPPAGPGMINCPKCHGSGNIQVYMPDGTEHANEYGAPANAYDGFAIFVFICCFTWAVLEINSHYQIGHKYEVGFIAIIVSLIIGIFIRNILVKLLGLLLLLGILYLAFALGYNYFF